MLNAYLIHHCLIHGSKENSSNQDRTGLTIRYKASQNSSKSKKCENPLKQLRRVLEMSIKL